MPVFEQDWLELGSRVARSLHYQARRSQHQAPEEDLASHRPPEPERARRRWGQLRLQVRALTEGQASINPRHWWRLWRR